MLDLGISRLRESRMIDYHSTVTRCEEGTLLVTVMENGHETVQPSAGVAGERVVGVAVNSRMTPVMAPAFEIVTVPQQAPFTVNLGRAPVGTLGMRGLTSDLAETLDTGANPVSGEYQIAGRVLTFGADAAGQRFRVSYQYSPTLLEIQTLFGQQGPQDDASDIIGATGVYFNADHIALTNFDPLSDWWGSTGPIFSGPNGTVTLTPGGTELTKCHVVEAPDVNSPYLHIRLDL